MKLALIGNCAYQALLDDRAAVVWLCWPRFDSSFVFGSLLDEQLGGVFRLLPDGPDWRTEQSYLPRTNILRTVFSSPQGSFEVLDLAPYVERGGSVHRPLSFQRRLRPLSGTPRLRVECLPTEDYGRQRAEPNAAAPGCQTWQLGASRLWLRSTDTRLLQTESGAQPLERDCYLVLDWDRPGPADLAAQFEELLLGTERRWHAWLDQASGSADFTAEVERSALALKLHQFEDTGAFTAATTMSLPEAPGTGRNWDYRYCWVRDSYFTALALARLGLKQEVQDYAKWLLRVLENTEQGVLQPLYGLSGETELTEASLPHLAGYLGNTPVRVGNQAFSQIQNDVYGEALAVLALCALESPVTELVDTPRLQRIVHLLVDKIQDTVEFPDAGIWEFRDHASVSTFSLLMHWIGGTTALRFAEQWGDAALQSKADSAVARASRLLEACWKPELGFYGDSTSSSNPDAAQFLLVTLGYLGAAHPRTRPHLEALGTRLRAKGPLMRRYDHPDGLLPHHGTFTVCGFWGLEALARAGQKEEARAGLRELLTYANHVGLFSEDLDPQTGQQWGNFPQAYSHAGLILAALSLESSMPTPPSPAPPSTVDITVNGETRAIAAGATLVDLIHDLGLKLGTVAVERNRAVVPRAEHAQTVLAPGDVIELVHFVGGG